MTHVIATLTDAAFDHEPLPTEPGRPGATAGLIEFAPLGGVSVGLWEMTPGVMRNADEDEIFLVHSGRATLTFPATGEVVEIGPGSVVRLNAGEESVWEVHEAVRKLYVCV